MSKLIRTIKAISVKKLDEGSIGFLTEEEDKWYNLNGDPEFLNATLETTIVKGNEIEFEFDSFNRIVSDLKLVGKTEKKEWKQKPKKNNEDINNLDSLLKSAHEKGLISINTEVVHIDYQSKTAVFKAIVTGIVKKKTFKINLAEKVVEQMEVIEEEVIGTFTAYGDATQDNVTGEIAKSWIRMAETRAICRALRWYTNNSAASEEEIPEKLPEKTEKEPLSKVLKDYLATKNEKVSTQDLIVKFGNEKTMVEIKKLLEEGIIFEPLPGYIQYLG